MGNNKTIAIFAGYSRKGLIDQFVLDYLSELSKSSDVVFVTDNFISNRGIKPLEPFVLKTICKPHGEYDFGSYKRGISFLVESSMLDNYNTLLLCNDSVIPYNFDYQYILEEFSDSGKSWGGCYLNRAENRVDLPSHLQSYFLCFQKEIFLGRNFIDFFMNVRKWKTKEDIVLHNEVGLSKLLLSNKSDFFCMMNKDRDFSDNLGFIELLDEGFPFVKKKLFRFSRMKYDLAIAVLGFLKSREGNLRAKKNMKKYILKNGTAFDRVVLISPLFLSGFLMKLKNRLGSLAKAVR